MSDPAAEPARSDSRRDYWERFSDETPKGWSTDLVDGTLRITLPTALELRWDAAAPHMSWSGPLGTDGGTSRLWHNSLIYLKQLITLPNGPETGVRVLRSLTDFLESPDGDLAVIRNGSLDHQIALQLRTLCEVRAWTLHQTDPLSAPIRALDDAAIRLVPRLYDYIDRGSLIGRSNHGVMLALAVLHSLVMFPECPSPHTPTAMLHSLERLIGAIVGDVGVVDENTPLYQGLYLSLLNQIIAFMSWAKLSSTSADQFLRYREAVEIAYRRMLMPDGSVPPLGDSTRSGNSKLSPLSGILFAQQEGLCIASGPQFYFALICGARGIIHKQLDDTALFLAVADRVLVADAGLASYDRRDARAQGIRSQWGHSGIFFERFDDLDADKVISYSGGSRSISTKLTMSEVIPQRPDLMAQASLRGLVVTRRIRWNDSASFSLSDTATGPVDEPAASRFVLHPEATVVHTEQHVLVRNGPAWLVLCGPSVRSLAQVRGDGHGRAGNFAVRPFQIVPTTVLVLRHDRSKMTSTVHIRASFGDATQPPWCSCCRVPVEGDRSP
ncbi:MAG: heparinase II/III family protein [Propioniciclava sp.]